MKKYRTIVADPPWPYPEGFAQNRGGRYGDGTSGPARVAKLPYAAMTLGEIRALPVEALAQARRVPCPSCDGLKWPDSSNCHRCWLESRRV